MKKIFLYMVLAAVTFNACKDDDDDTTEETVTLDTRNSYDDEAAQKFLQEYYLDDRGNLKAFDNDDDSDDNYTKLADLEPVKLPSGVIYIVRPGAQPEPGTTIGESDILHLMVNATTYVATNTDGTVEFTSASTFQNTIASGNVIVDPAYYYVKQSVLDDATTDAAKQRSYYQIEGLREGLEHFKAFNMSDGDNYNLQGVIIVPSRAAFARDSHYNYTNISYNDRSFVFNFQVYKTEARD